MSGVSEWFAHQREKHVWIDHSVRTYERIDDVRGNWVAGSLTYTTFLAIFPILLVVYSVAGWVLNSNPDALEAAREYLEENLPFVDVSAVTNASLPAGIIGAVGMVLTGVNWVGEVRESVRSVFHAPTRTQTGNPVLGFLYVKLRDAGAFIGLLSVVALSAVVSFALASVLNWLLDDSHASALSALNAPLLSFLIGLIFDVVLLVMLVRVIPRIEISVRALWLPLLVAAVGVEVLKLLAGVLIEKTQHNPAYTVVAAAVGLLIFLNFFYRIVVAVAAWLASDPGVDTVSAGGKNEAHGS